MKPVFFILLLFVIKWSFIRLLCWLLTTMTIFRVLRFLLLRLQAQKGILTNHDVWRSIQIERIRILWTCEEVPRENKFDMKSYAQNFAVKKLKIYREKWNKMRFFITDNSTLKPFSSSAFTAEETAIHENHHVFSLSYHMVALKTVMQYIKRMQIIMKLSLSMVSPVLSLWVFSSSSFLFFWSIFSQYFHRCELPFQAIQLNTWLLLIMFCYLQWLQFPSSFRTVRFHWIPNKFSLLCLQMWIEYW